MTDAWLQDAEAYESYSAQCTPVPVEIDDEQAYRVEIALREIEEAATIGEFRPSVANKCLAEIRHKVKQIRQDLEGLS